MGDTTSEETRTPLHPAHDNPAIRQLRFRACWAHAAEQLRPQATHDPTAACQRAVVLVEQCLFALTGWEEAERSVIHALALAADDHDRAAALSEAGWLAYVWTAFQSDDRAAEAADVLSEAASLAEPGSTVLAWLELRRGLVAEKLLERADEAGAHYHRADQLAGSLDDTLLRSYTTRHLGSLAYEAQETDAARRLFSESLELRYDCGFAVGVAPALVALAAVSETDQADLLRAQAQALVRSLGDIPVWLA